MNEGWTIKLLAACRGQVDMWGEHRRHGAPLQPPVYTADELAFVIFADHVETWIGELEKIIEALQQPQADDYAPQCDWPVQAWIAYHGGKLCSIDVQMNGKLASLGSGERDATPRFHHFSRLYDVANNLYYKLREQQGMNAERKATETFPPVPEGNGKVVKYPEHKPTAEVIE